MNPIFTNNTNSSSGQNPFNTGNRPVVNPFSNNPPANQNQNTQNQPVIMQNQHNLPANKPIPSGPRIQDSLQQKHSFVGILLKIASKKKLTTSELEFVTKNGFLMFEKDEWKTHHFLTVKSKQPLLGYGTDAMLYKGEIQKCEKINKIWIKIIKHFAHVTGTNEMNGYFLLKKILIDGRYCEELYQPKYGLANKVFEPNYQNIAAFFIIQMDGTSSVNKNGAKYVEILHKMIDNYYNEFNSFLSIIKTVGTRIDGNLRGESSARNQQVVPQGNQPGAHQHKLCFADLLKQNIMEEMWKIYKKFALSLAPRPGSDELKGDDKARIKWQNFRRIFFRTISDTITSIIKVQFSQQMLMENQPIPLLQAIDFVTKDISTVQIENLIEPQIQTAYIDSGLDLILAVIPFASFILNDTLLTSYFNLLSQKNRFINARQHQNRVDILERLATVKIVEFEPISILAKLQLKRIQLINQSTTRKPDPQKEKERKEQAVEIWEKYLNKETANFDIFEDNKWKYWVGLFVENTSIQAIIQSTTIRGHIVYYCKRTLKGRGGDFFRFWQGILSFEYTDEGKDIKNTLQNIGRNPTGEQRRKPIYVLPSKILRNLELYTTGRFLKEIHDSNYLNEALNVFTALIKRRQEQDPSRNYTQNLKFFLHKGEEMPREPIDSLLLQNVIATLSSVLGIRCKGKDSSSHKSEFQREKEMDFRIYDQSLDYEIKFFCQLAIQNRYQLETLQEDLFDSRGHLEITGDIPGIRTCIFLCKILERINTASIENLKSMRYLIRAIDYLFTCQETQELILCALSVVFPCDQGRKHQLMTITRTTDRNGTELSTRKCAWNIVELLQLEQNSELQSSEQVKKLRKTISYHFNHMLKSCDSIDEYFTINKDYDQPQLYSTIDSQINNWRFTAISNFLKDHKRRFRATDWFYTFAKVLQFNNLLPIDIDSIIEAMRKMRIPNDGNYVSFGPMTLLMKIINRGSILDQMLKFLKPIGCEHKVAILIENEKLASYKPAEIKTEQPNGKRYSKYQNTTVVEYKSAKLVMDQQYQILRTICLYARLIEQVLRLRLDSNTFESYSLLYSLEFLEKIFKKLTIPEEIHQFRAETTDNSESATKINIIASLVALLNLYSYNCKFPAKMIQMKDKLQPLLELVERSSINNIAVEDKWNVKTYTMKISDENVDFYINYGEDFKYQSEKYFESVLYEMNDFSFQNDDTSLRTTVFSILQLLFDNKCGKIVAHALSNYSYPIKCTGNLTDYSLTNKYLFNDTHKNLAPLLFSHVNQMLNLLNSPSIYDERFNLSHIVRTIQSLSVFVFEPFLAKQVIDSLASIRRSLVKLITADDIYKDQICSKAQQINILNRIALFVLRLIERAKISLPQNEFQEKIIEKFLINPENILKMLFERMTELSKDFRIDNLCLIETATDEIPNNLMQVRLTRNTLYRATYDIMIKIMFSVLQFLQKNQVTEIISYLLFRNYQLITTKPKQIKFEPEIIMKLNLFPSQTIQIGYKFDQAVPTTILSEKVTNFDYCNRMNFRKYGPNFLYDTNLAFHLIKALINDDNENAEQVKLKVRKQVYLIQLTNCMKSLYFSYQSMVKSYFQLMLLLTNTGPVGQNLSVLHLDKTIPKTYQQAILQNKYCLKNKFSFVQSIQSLKKMIVMDSEESIITKFVMIMEEFLTNVQFESVSYEVLFREIEERQETAIRGIPRNAIYANMVFLETQITHCVNPNDVAKFLRNISNALMEHFSVQKELKSTADRYTLFLEYFLRILNKFPFSLTVILQCYSSILTQYNKVVQISSAVIKQKMLDPSTTHRNFNVERINKIHENWLYEKVMGELNVKNQVIMNCSRVLFKFYENQRHNNIFKTGSLKRQQPQQDEINLFYVEKDELERNIDLLCAITSQVYDEPCKENLFSLDLYQETQKSINSSVHYIIKLLMENLESLSSPINKVSIFSLCNNFYLTNSAYPVTKWHFHSNHFERCKEILVKKVTKKENPTERLERIIALDSFCTFSLANQNSTLHSEILPIMMQVINLENNYLLRYEESRSQDNDHHSLRKNYFPQNSARYNLTERATEDLTIEKLIEYKKLMMTILVSLPQEKWTDNLFASEANALYLEILRFEALDLSSSKLQPTKPVEVRLSNLIVTDQLPNKLSHKVPNYLPNNLPISSSKGNSLNNVPSRSYQIAAHNSYKNSHANQTLSTFSSTKMSLFDFMCFIHHNEFIHSYLLIMRNGIDVTRIFDASEGFFLEKIQYAEIYDSIESKIHSLFEYFSSWADSLLDNPRMIANLTNLYNYVCQDPSYLVEFDSLTLFMDPIDTNYVRDQLVYSIAEYCSIVAEMMPKIRNLEWKAAANRRQQRQTCLKYCIHLLNNIKIINAFKGLNVYETLHKSLKENLEEQIEKEQSPKIIKRSVRFN